MLAGVGVVGIQAWARFKPKVVQPLGWRLPKSPYTGFYFKAMRLAGVGVVQLVGVDKSPR